MFKRLIVIGLCAAGLACCAAQDKPDAKPAPQQKEQPKMRRCFRDADRDGKCDNSISEGRKCRRNCVNPNVKPAPQKPEAKPASDRKTDGKPPCGTCPLAGKCTEQPKVIETKEPACDYLRRNKPAASGQPETGEKR